MDVSELRQIVEMFIHEADDTLSQFEQCFLELEQTGPSDHLLDKIFRIAHNLKGSSAALGFTELAGFTHHFESFLLGLKKREIQVSAEVVSLLLGGRDFISDHIECLKTGKRSPGLGESLTDAMQRVRAAKPVSPPITLPRPPAAGDIWFVGNDLKAELFEMPEIKPDEPETPETEMASTEATESTSDPINNTDSAKTNPSPAVQLDAKITAIQAEIARLTLLAAQVNQSTVQAAAAQDQSTSDLNSSTNDSLRQGPTIPSIESAQVLSTSSDETVTEISSTPEKEQLPSNESDVLTTAPSSALNTQNTLKTLIQNSDNVPTADGRPTQALVEVETKDRNESTSPIKESLLPETAKLPAALLSGAAQTDESVRVNLNRIDKLMNFVGELVILQSVLDEHHSAFQSPLLQKSVAQMSKLIREVQEISMGLRMVRLKSVFLKLQRVVRDTSRQLNKEIEGIFVGEETEIDKTVLDRISDPLVHLVRNSLDHGIESSEERARAGKQLKGSVKVNAYQQSRAIVIEVSDDGRGLDTEKIKAKAIERGLMRQFEQLSEEKIRSFIFHPGFSTRSTVTDISGRGVGLDVVASNVAAMHGRIEIDSVVGHGCCFRIILPLTVAVVDGFVVKLDRERFVIAKFQVAESLRPHEADVKSINGQTEMLNLRGQTIPLFHLSQLLKKQSQPPRGRTTFDGIALVVNEEGIQPFAVIVDDIVAQQQVVIKKLGAELQNIAGLSGAAILGDGKPAVILDLQELVHAQMKDRMSDKNKTAVYRAA